MSTVHYSRDNPKRLRRELIADRRLVLRQREATLGQFEKVCEHAARVAGVTTRYSPLPVTEDSEHAADPRTRQPAWWRRLGHAVSRTVDRLGTSSDDFRLPASLLEKHWPPPQPRLHPLRKYEEQALREVHISMRDAPPFGTEARAEFSAVAASLRDRMRGLIDDLVENDTVRGWLDSELAAVNAALDLPTYGQEPLAANVAALKRTVVLSAVERQARRAPRTTVPRTAVTVPVEPKPCPDAPQSAASVYDYVPEPDAPGQNEQSALR